MDTSFLNSPVFWVIIAILGTSLGYRLIRSIPLVKKIPKKTFFWGGIIGIVLTMGLLGGAFTLFGTGALSSTGDIVVDRIQTTTAFTMDNSTGGVDLADSGIDDTRQSDFYLTEGIANGNAYIENGVFLVTRSGKLDPASCEVRIHKPPRYDISDTTYHIVDEDANTGVMNAYIATAATSGAASTSSPKETNQLAFAEGVSGGYVGLRIDIDETGFDPLTQYDYKDIVVDLCGYNYIFRVHKADA